MTGNDVRVGALVAALALTGACHPDPSAPSLPTVTPPTIRPPTAPTAPRVVADVAVSDESAAMSEVHARLGTSPVAVLLNGGPGARADVLRRHLRAVLLADPRVTLAVATIAPDAPVADPSVPGGHVNTVTVRVTPRPNVVIGVSEHDNTLYLVGSDPGPDGLGDSAGRRWVIHFRAAGVP